MSKVILAKQPRLDFLLTSNRGIEKNNCTLPIILKNDGHFDWDANGFLTEYGGGPQVYNIRPLAQTIVKKAYSLNIFCSFLEKDMVKLCSIDDSVLYSFVESLKKRGVNDQTILSHGRVALEYIVHLSSLHPEWQLATTDPNPISKFNVNYSIASFNKRGRIIHYLKHRSLDGLIHISAESDFVRDYELVMWLDAINCTDYHPQVDDFLISRWQALTTLLEITGSRISEVHHISRTMIKDASKSLRNMDQPQIIRNIPVLKGKYKGKTRVVTTSSEELQVILLHINMVENMFSCIDHDAIFVDSKSGKPLKASYLKNYSKKVINGSKYQNHLRHLSNHSFRHRFITLNIAKAIESMATSGSFVNILNVAANACRKLTMHASNQTLSQYIHLASDYNYKLSKDSDVNSQQLSLKFRKMESVVEALKNKKISEQDALNALLLTIG